MAGFVRLGAAALMLLAFVASTVRAQETPFLRERVTDLAGVLDDIEEVEDALDELEDEHGVQLWVLFVDTTGSMNVTAYAEDVADANSFGGNDALVVVAIDDRTDALWVGPLLDDVTDTEIDLLLAEELEPRLASGEFDGGVVALATRLGEAYGGDITETPDGEDGGGGGIGIGTVLLFLVVAGLVVGSVWFIVRKVRGRRATREQAQTDGDLARRAGGLLLEADDILRDSEQELGFAEAQFVEQDVAPFRTALEGARVELRAAFALQQELDDNDPEPPDLRRQKLEELIGRTEKVKSLLTAERDRLAGLRDLERTAPDVFAGLPSKLEEVDSRITAAEDQFANLQRFAEATWKPLQGNIVEARKRLDFVREVHQAGLPQADPAHPGKIVATVRSAQKALADAAGLLEAIERQWGAVSDAQAALPGELAAAEADIRAARNALASRPETTGADDLSRAESLLESARRESVAARPDVLGAVRMAQEANTGADAVLASVRAHDERRQRELTAYQATARRAETAVNQASDYISSRRRGLGREPLTRLTEAERHLEVARDLERLDLVKATGEAQTAERLASEALRLAQRDFERVNTTRPRSATRTGQPSGGGADVAGSVLGGILGSILTGGLGGGPGFGGTTWGSPGRSSRGGGGFRLPSGGGGGGGRSRGGRW